MNNFGATIRTYSNGCKPHRRRSVRNLRPILLDRIKGEPADGFERVVVDLPLKMGYGGSRADAGQAIGKSGDEGLDGIIKEDMLGLEISYLQAERRTATIGRP
jgi:restriction system protein